MERRTVVLDFIQTVSFVIIRLPRHYGGVDSDYFGSEQRCELTCVDHLFELIECVPLAVGMDGIVDVVLVADCRYIVPDSSVKIAGLDVYMYLSVASGACARLQK